MTMSASGLASAAVSSALPPSTTITSAPRARSGASAVSDATMAEDSLRTGTMIERRAAGSGIGAWRLLCRRRDCDRGEPDAAEAGKLERRVAQIEARDETQHVELDPFDPSDL